MSAVQWMFEGVLIVLLAATLFHAVRLERALGVLRRDRAALEALIHGFNDSTRLAEDGVRRLQFTAEDAAKQITRQVERASEVRSDLISLSERGEKIADSLERRISESRRPRDLGRQETEEPHTMFAASRSKSPAFGHVRSKAERELLHALQIAK